MCRSCQRSNSETGRSLLKEPFAGLGTGIFAMVISSDIERYIVRPHRGQRQQIQESRGRLLSWRARIVLVKVGQEKVCYRAGNGSMLELALVGNSTVRL